MTITPIAYFRSPFTSKFGIPRQSGVISEIRGEIVFTEEYRFPEAIKGIEEFSHLWLIWEFSGNGEGVSLTVRPPRLGGNKRIGVFASRSPFRPNRLGLSSVEIIGIVYTKDGAIIQVKGADLMDGTPIYDIKPYISYSDSHPDAKCGFVDCNSWPKLTVVFPEELRKPFETDLQKAIIIALEQDPRPHYHNDAQRIYGMPFAGYDIRFRVENSTATVTDVVKINDM